MKRRRPTPFVGDAAASLASRLIAYSLSLLSAIAISRALGAEAKGIISVATAVPGLAALVIGAGLGASATVSLRERWLPVASAVRLLAAYATVTGVTCLAAAVGLELWHPTGGPPYGAAAAASIGGLLLADYAGGLLQGRGRVAAGMWIRQAVGIGHALAALLLIAAGVGEPFTILLLMATWAWACGAVGILLVVRTRHVGGPSERSASGSLRRLLGFGIRSQAVWILLLLNYRLDLVLLGALGSLEEVGVYSVAVGFAEVVWFGANAVISILLPHLAGVDAALVASRTTAALRAAIVSTAVLAVVCSIGLALLAEPLFGPEFAAAPIALAVLAPGLVAMSGFKVFAVHSVATHRTSLAIALAAAGVTLNVVLNIVLIPPFGGVGAALASTVSYTAISAVALRAVFRLLRPTRPDGTPAVAQGELAASTGAAT
jgi:O-antigen/teichoic acid export membrane protein